MANNGSKKRDDRIMIRALGRMFGELSPDARYLVVERQGRRAVVDLRRSAEAKRVVVVKVEERPESE